MEGLKCKLKGKLNSQLYYFDKNIPGPGKYTPRYEIAKKRIISR